MVAARSHDAYTNVAFSPGTRFSYSNLGVVFLGGLARNGQQESVSMFRNRANSTVTNNFSQAHDRVREV